MFVGLMAPLVLMAVAMSLDHVQRWSEHPDPVSGSSRCCGTGCARRAALGGRAVTLQVNDQRGERQVTVRRLTIR